MKNNILEKISEEYINQICEETDKLIKENEEIEIDESLDKSIYSFINNEYEKKNKFKLKLNFEKNLNKKIAAVIVLLLIVGSLLVYDIGKNRYENTVNVIFSDETDLLDENINKKLSSFWKSYYVPTYLPDGYNFHTLHRSPSLAYVNVKDINNNSILIYEINKGGEIEMSLDIVEEKDVKVGELKAILKKTKDKLVLDFVIEKRIIIYGNIDEFEMIKIAESLKIID